jgi:ribosomal protein S18 acetylase RimI-like enzyme
MASLNFEVVQTVQPESRDAIARGLRDFNAAHLGDFQWTTLDVYVRDADGQIVAGLIGDSALGWLSIHALWVAEDLRRAGVGASILKAAEDAAIERGCHAAVLDTLSFQAPDLYEKRGYIRVGTIESYRGGVQRIFMQSGFVKTGSSSRRKTIRQTRIRVEASQRGRSLSDCWLRAAPIGPVPLLRSMRQRNSFDVLYARSRCEPRPM